MPSHWKTIRVFISSTFRDMQAERDWLVRFVFPKLREDLLKYHIHLVDVDLRWGVTAEQDALGVCREVIDECHPRFLCMLGGRYGWVPEGQDRSITAEEIYYGVLSREPAKRKHAFFYFRQDSATVRMEGTPGDFLEVDGSASAARLASLKKAVTDAGLAVFTYDAQWDIAQKRLTGLEVFGNRVHHDLLQSLKDDPELAARFKGESGAGPDEFAEEADQMEEFIEERTDGFVIGSREPLMRDMLTFAGADGVPNVLILTGDPGSGKSALLAKFTREISQSSITSNRLPLLLPHFIGASTGSTDLRRTLRRLCHELARAAGSTEPLPLDVKDLITHFQKLLAEAAGRRRVILVLDGLNQFDPTDGGHSLNWLPRELPPSVRIVASVIAPAHGQSEHQALAILRTRPGARVEKLEPLSETDTLTIINGYLKHYAKRLSLEQLAALLAKPAVRLPLYVLTALEELRTLGPYEEITAGIHALPGDARALFAWILTQRLARDPGLCDREGRLDGAALVEKLAACLGVSRHGLSPAELTALLDPGDPLGNVAALLRLLRPYLMRRGELLDFYHGQFREAAAAAYLSSESRRRAAHNQLALYFSNRPLWMGEAATPQPNLRRCAELPFQQTGAEMWNELVATLTDLNFVDAKCKSGMVHDLVADYNRARRALPEGVEEQRKEDERQARIKEYVDKIIAHSSNPDNFPLPNPPATMPFQPQGLSGERHGDWTPLDQMKAWGHFISNHIQPLAAGEEPVFQLAWNSASSGPVAQRVADLQNEGRGCSTSWLRLRNPPPFSLNPACLRTLEGHTGCVEAISITADGRRAVSGGGYKDNTIREWDLETGACLSVLEGHSEQVSSVAVTPDGRRAASGSYDKTVRIWNLETGDRRVFYGHTHYVYRVAITSDGRYVVSTSCDNTIRVWDVETGGSRVLGEDAGNSNGVAAATDGHFAMPGLLDFFAVAITQDGRGALWGGSGNSLRIWDLETGRVRVLEGPPHPGTILTVSITPDGRRAVSGGGFARSLRVWDLDTGESDALGEQSDSVFSVSITPDGRRAVSGTNDHTLCVWDIETGQSRALRGHTHDVNAVSITPDGRRALSGSADHSIRLWDIELAEQQITEGHAGPAHAVSITPDGRHALSAGGFRDDTVRLWNLETTESRVLDGHSRSVDAISVASDGRHAVSGGSEHAASGFYDSLRIWDLDTGESRVLGVRTDHVTAVSITPDGRHAVSGGGVSGEDKSRFALHVWDLETGASRALKGHADRVNAIAVSPDGRIAVSVSGDNSVRVWDLVRGKCRVMKGHTEEVNAVAITPDGRRAVSGSDDNTLRVWDLATGASKVLKGHAGCVAAVSITADGRCAISGDGNKGSRQYSDFALRLWDLATGECLAVCTLLSSIDSIATCGLRLVAGEHSGRVDVLEFENYCLRRPVLTATRLWRFEGHIWNADLSSQCPWCGKLFVVHKEWIGRQINCPIDGCGEPLELNPFVCDSTRKPWWKRLFRKS